MTRTQPQYQDQPSGGWLSRVMRWLSDEQPPPQTHTITQRSHTPTSRGILASARRLTGKDLKDRNTLAQGGSATKVTEWQEEAWELLDVIGEQRFLVNTLAGRMSQAALYVGKINPEDSPGTAPEHEVDEVLQEILSSIGDGIAGQAQLIYRAGVNLSVAGEVWLVGIPPRLVPGTPEYSRSRAIASGELAVVDRESEELDHDDIFNLVWRMLSVSEISVKQDETVVMTLEGGETVSATADDLYLIRIWRPHPRRAWEADSPTRASLPVLRELLGLTQHIGAQVDSRLAGAGLLGVSTEASDALKKAEGLESSDPRDPLMEALTEAMQTPIHDRASAAAIVPLIVTTPGHPADHFHYMTFSTPLDEESRNLRDESIRRLALGQDAPPELLLGTGGMNHWGAWLVREDVVKTHLEPPLTLICDALTTQYLRPIMRQMGYSEEEVLRHVVWFDVDHLVARPNRTQDAKDLFTQGAISAKALREATGFEDSDAPEESLHDSDPAVRMVLQMVTQAPSLAHEPGLPALLEQVRAMLDGSSATLDAVGTQPAEQQPSSGGSPDALPDTAGDPPPVGTPGNPGGDMS